MLPKFIPSVTQNKLILQSFFSLHVKMFPKLLKDDCTQSHHSLAKRNACALICVYVWHSTYILRSHQAWTTWQQGVIASRDQEQLKIYFTKPGKIDKTILSYFFRRQVRCFCFQERKISLRERALWKEATQLTLQDWPGVSSGLRPFVLLFLGSASFTNAAASLGSHSPYDRWSWRT